MRATCIGMKPVADIRITVRPAQPRDISAAGALIRPFVARGDLLPRSAEELASFLPHAFVAVVDGEVAGFVALEIYSRKLSEIQCLSFGETPLAPEIVRELVRHCAQRAREHAVLEMMAVVAATLEEVLKTCGFDYALPHQKRAMFVRPHLVDPRWSMNPLSKVTIGDAAMHDWPAVVEFLAPFVARGEVLRRSPTELAHLLRDGFVAKAEGRIVGFVALEIYSEKLAEIQCLSVDDAYRGQGIGRRLVMRCVQRANENHVAEAMAISSREDLFKSCGFDSCLPGAKTALFCRTREE